VETPQKPTILALIDLLRRLAQSENKFLRGFGTLLAAGLLDRTLAELTDKQVGQLLCDFVERDLGLVLPETIVCRQASMRLFRSEGGSFPDEPLLRQPCPKCGNVMLPRYGIGEPDFRQCVSLACRYKIEEKLHG
jgi:hypothetical protein